MKWTQKYTEMGSGSKNYTVTRNQDNEFTCSCPATDYRPWLKACKHIKHLKHKLRING